MDVPTEQFSAGLALDFQPTSDVVEQVDIDMTNSPPPPAIDVAEHTAADYPTGDLTALLDACAPSAVLNYGITATVPHVHTREYLADAAYMPQSVSVSNAGALVGIAGDAAGLGVSSFVVYDPSVTLFPELARLVGVPHYEAPVTSSSWPLLDTFTKRTDIHQTSAISTAWTSDDPYLLARSQAMRATEWYAAVEDQLRGTYGRSVSSPSFMKLQMIGAYFAPFGNPEVRVVRGGEVHQAMSGLQKSQWGPLMDRITELKRQRVLTAFTNPADSPQVIRDRIDTLLAQWGTYTLNLCPNALTPSIRVFMTRYELRLYAHSLLKQRPSVPARGAAQFMFEGGLWATGNLDATVIMRRVHSTVQPRRHGLTPLHRCGFVDYRAIFPAYNHLAITCGTTCTSFQLPTSALIAQQYSIPALSSYFNARDTLIKRITAIAIKRAVAAYYMELSVDPHVGETMMVDLIKFFTNGGGKRLRFRREGKVNCHIVMDYLCLLSLVHPRWITNGLSLDDICGPGGLDINMVTVQPENTMEDLVDAWDRMQDVTSVPPPVTDEQGRPLYCGHAWGTSPNHLSTFFEWSAAATAQEYDGDSEYMEAFGLFMTTLANARYPRSFDDPSVTTMKVVVSHGWYRRERLYRLHGLMAYLCYLNGLSPLLVPPAEGEVFDELDAVLGGATSLCVLFKHGELMAGVRLTADWPQYAEMLRLTERHLSPFEGPLCKAFYLVYGLEDVLRVALATESRRLEWGTDLIHQDEILQGTDMMLRSLRGEAGVACATLLRSLDLLGRTAIETFVGAVALRDPYDPATTVVFDHDDHARFPVAPSCHLTMAQHLVWAASERVPDFVYLTFNSTIGTTDWDPEVALGDSISMTSIINTRSIWNISARDYDLALPLRFFQIQGDSLEEVYTQLVAAIKPSLWTGATGDFDPYGRNGLYPLPTYLPVIFVRMVRYPEHYDRALGRLKDEWPTARLFIPPPVYSSSSLYIAPTVPDADIPGEVVRSQLVCAIVPEVDDVYYLGAFPAPEDLLVIYTGESAQH